MTALSDAALVTLVGFAGGCVLGLASRLARFCTLGAIEDAYYGGSRERMLMWPLALGVSIFSAFLLAHFGLADLEASVYLRFEFSLTASIAGGLMFGIGMALAGNCGFGALSRLGGGDLRSLLLVLVIGISSYAAAVGPLAEFRLRLFPRAEIFGIPPDGIAHKLTTALGLPVFATATVISAVLVCIALLDREFRRNTSAVVWSALVGLAITSGWLGTSWIARTGFDVVGIESHTFTMPLGEIVLQTMTSTAWVGGFSVGSVFGVLSGAFVGAVVRRQFKLEACDEPRELIRQIFGAILMGIGGVISLGCSVGQGMSAFSVLAISAPITAASIGVGAVIGLRYLVEGSAIMDTISALCARSIAPLRRSPKVRRGQ